MVLGGDRFGNLLLGRRASVYTGQLRVDDDDNNNNNSNIDYYFDNLAFSPSFYFP